MRFVLTPALAAGLALALAPAARAQDEEQVYKKITVKQMERVLRDLGYDFTKKSEADDKVQRWVFELENSQVMLLSDGTDMQLYTSPTGTLTSSAMNEWNRTKRFNRAYIGKEKNLCLESDLDFAGGVTMNQVKEFIKLYGVVLKAFKKFIREKSDE